MMHDQKFNMKQPQKQKHYNIAQGVQYNILRRNAF